MDLGLGQPISHPVQNPSVGGTYQTPAKSTYQATALDEVRLPDTHAPQQTIQPPRPAYPEPETARAPEKLPDLPVAFEPALNPNPRNPNPYSLPTSHPAHPSNGPPTSTMDPNIPSDQSAPTALPTNATTSPHEQRRAIADEHPAVVAREIEKTKAEEREIKGEKPKGTVVSGIEDDRLWAMLRRFDVQITHVLHPAHKLPPSEPDLRPSTLPNLPSHSEILKSNLERTFAAIGPPSLRGTREMGRLMSWSPEERIRTGIFCASYFTAWLLGYALVAVFLFGVVVVIWPETRRWLFPAIPPPPFTPPSATDPTNQKGDESILGNVDNKTVHRSKAEQAEEQAFEATSILQAYTARLIFDGRKKGKEAGNSEVGEKRLGSSSDDDAPTHHPHESKTTMATQDGNQGLESSAVVIGGEQIIPDKPLNDKEKKKLAQREAKRKRDEMVSKMTKVTEDTLGAFADTIERFTNALNPPEPYPDSLARFKIAGAFLIPPMLLFTFVPAWIFGRSATFFFGVGMWAQPLLIEAGKKFVELVPDWQDRLDIRNSILSGVPTDQQLTLHLLRVAEALNVPLPRPPPAPLEGSPKEAIKDTSPATITAEDDASLISAEQEGGLSSTTAKVKHKTKSQVLGLFQKAGKKMAGFHGDVAVDGTKRQAKIDSGEDLDDGIGEGALKKVFGRGEIGEKIDRLLYKGYTKDEGTRESYPARLDGTAGHLVLEPKNDTLIIPHVSFVPVSGGEASFTLPIDDIVEIKKAHVSMPRIALGWASGAEVEGLGLTIRFKTVEQQMIEANGAVVTKDDGLTMNFKRVGRREELFVRLVSMGRQRWEVL